MHVYKHMDLFIYLFVCTYIEKIECGCVCTWVGFSLKSVSFCDKHSHPSSILILHLSSSGGAFRTLTASNHDLNNGLGNSNAPHGALIFTPISAARMPTFVETWSQAATQLKSILKQPSLGEQLVAVCRDDAASSASNTSPERRSLQGSVRDLHSSRIPDVEHFLSVEHVCFLGVVAGVCKLV